MLVILLMFTGIIVRIIISANGYDEIGFLDNLIPVLGTIGLILSGTKGWRINVDDGRVCDWGNS